MGQSDDHIGAHHLATLANPPSGASLAHDVLLAEGLAWGGSSPGKGVSTLCAPGLPVPLHGLQSAGSWQIIPST